MSTSFRKACWRAVAGPSAALLFSAMLAVGPIGVANASPGVPTPPPVPSPSVIESPVSPPVQQVPSQVPIQRSPAEIPQMSPGLLPSTPAPAPAPRPPVPTPVQAPTPVPVPVPAPTPVPVPAQVPQPTPKPAPEPQPVPVPVTQPAPSSVPGSSGPSGTQGQQATPPGTTSTPPTSDSGGQQATPPGTTSTPPTSDSGGQQATPPGTTSTQTPTTPSGTNVESAPTVKSIVKPPPPLQSASEEAVQQAESSVPVEASPAPASEDEVGQVAKAVTNAISDSGKQSQDSRGDQGPVWDHQVRSWNWVRYDNYHRPVIYNPCSEPYRFVYYYGNTSRVVVVAPGTSVVVDVSEIGTYSFTAVQINAFGVAVNVAVGSFNGGGYDPGSGIQPPPPVLWPTYNNVRVEVWTGNVVKYAYVQRVVDGVNDPSHNDMRKVLLDGVYPTWGHWTTSGKVFVANESQQFPGISTPQPGVPYEYTMQMANNAVASSSSNTLAWGVAGALGLIVIIGTASWGISRKRSRYSK